MSSIALEKIAPARVAPAGLAGWLLNRWRNVRRSSPRLAVVERLQLAPRQSVALIEADGQRFLVATGHDGAPSVTALAPRPARTQTVSARISW